MRRNFFSMIFILLSSCLTALAQSDDVPSPFPWLVAKKIVVVRTAQEYGAEIRSTYLSEKFVSKVLIEDLSRFTNFLESQMSHKNLSEAQKRATIDYLAKRIKYRGGMEIDFFADQLIRGNETIIFENEASWPRSYDSSFAILLDAIDQLNLLSQVGLVVRFQSVTQRERLLTDLKLSKTQIRDFKFLSHSLTFGLTAVLSKEFLMELNARQQKTLFEFAFQADTQWRKKHNKPLRHQEALEFYLTPKNEKDFEVIADYFASGYLHKTEILKSLRAYFGKTKKPFLLEKLFPQVIQKLKNTFAKNDGPNCFDAAHAGATCSLSERTYLDAADLNRLMADQYRKVPVESVRSGDILTFYDYDGLVHAAMVISKDILFTKNGMYRSQPYVFQWRMQTQELYENEDVHRYQAYRLKTHLLCEEVFN